MLPAEEYSQRLQARESLAAYHEKVHHRCGNIRLLIFLAAAVMAWESLRAHHFSAWWLLLPAAGFFAVAAFHSRVLRRRDLARRAVVFYQQGLARIEDRWAGSGSTGARFTDPHHVYAADLDLFGRGGLFELLSTARTRMGEEKLAAWLLAPASPERIIERQGAAAELRAQLDLREELAVLGEDSQVGVHPAELLQWAEAPARMQWPPLRVVAAILAALAVAGIVIWALKGTITPFLLVVLIEGAIIYRLRKPMDEVLHGAEHALRDLDLLSGVLARVEQSAFASPKLRALHNELISRGMAASQAIARLRTIGDLIDSRDNMFVRVLDVPLMYSAQVSLAAERWRRAHGYHVGIWLEAIAELEALLALAAYSYEHPADPFPEIASGPACLVAQGLGHPLLPAASCVRNDLSLCAETRGLLVSGSNMSGKSTLLRAVGLNVVLAMAGATVRAHSLRLTPLQTGASIRINDSLQEGSSRFYSEITRLRHLFDLAGAPPPLLFLLDELLQGTNSSDRRIGAEGVVKALLERGAIGLLTTHDLALTEIGGGHDGNLRNVHFQDEFVEGKITFDYRLRDGVVAKSNGLALMRSIGLDV
ncbi:MAG TPA: mismatch repair protein [Candidatus Angelobacter sp.]|nr:mismatch repair protein [Candidatus Angelobacter sp.]